MIDEVVVKKATEDLLQKLHVDGLVSVKHQDDAYYVLIEGEELGVVIGYHGEGLYALQHVLSLMIATKSGEWHQLFVDVGGWRAAREEALVRQAGEIADQVVERQQAYVYDHLEPAERRVIHVALSERKDIVTESQGSGRGRRLIVSPAEKNA